MNFDDLTKGERFIVDWKYGLAGGFKSALLHAIAKADSGNQEKLKAGFCSEVTAFQNYTNVEGWWTELQERIK